MPPSATELSDSPSERAIKETAAPTKAEAEATTAAEAEVAATTPPAEKMSTKKKTPTAATKS